METPQHMSGQGPDPSIFMLSAAKCQAIKSSKCGGGGEKGIVKPCNNCRAALPRQMRRWPNTDMLLNTSISSVDVKLDRGNDLL